MCCILLDSVLMHVSCCTTSRGAKMCDVIASTRYSSCSSARYVLPHLSRKYPTSCSGSEQLNVGFVFYSATLLEVVWALPGRSLLFCILVTHRASVGHGSCCMTSNAKVCFVAISFRVCMFTHRDHSLTKWPCCTSTKSSVHTLCLSPATRDAR